MTKINQLPLLAELVSGDQCVVWSYENGDTRRVPFSEFKAAVLASPAITGTATLNGLTVTIGANNSGGAGLRALCVPNT